MKCKVKKIPKYSNGNAGTSVLDTILKNNEAPYVGNVKKAPMGGNLTGTPSFGTQSNNSSFSWENAAGTVAASAPSVAGAFGIRQGKAAAIANTVGDIAGLIPGVGPFISAGVKAVAPFLGEAGKVDENTGEILGDSGILGMNIFGGHSDEWYARKSNRIKNTNLATQQSENIKADYYNQNLTGSIAINAAEGGVMRKPVDALVSPGEIAIDPYTLEYKQFGSDNEEPNSKDNIKTVLKTGDIVKSHAKHMKMPNGKTPADNSKMVLDSNMPDEMKRKMIKKINNWESAHRTKPQEYAKFAEGDPGFFSYLMSNRTRPIDAVISEYMK